ncbi:MAG: hypothetical protein ACTH3E_08460 [Psychroflexus halocasei]
MSVLQNINQKFQEEFMANAVLGIILSSCLGSIAAMMILIDGNTIFNLIHLTWIVSVCMIYNMAFIVHLKENLVLNILYLSVASSLLTILYHIIF